MSEALDALKAALATIPMQRGEIEKTALVDGLGRVIARVTVRENPHYGKLVGEERDDLAEALTLAWSVAPDLIAENERLREAPHMSDDKALVEGWRKARGAMPASQHDYINGLLEVGGRLATALEARAGRDEGLREEIAKTIHTDHPSKDKAGNYLDWDETETHRERGAYLDLADAILALLPSQDEELERALNTVGESIRTVQARCEAACKKAREKGDNNSAFLFEGGYTACEAVEAEIRTRLHPAHRALKDNQP